MNISLWKKIVSFIELRNYPLLPCPYCQQTELGFDKSSIRSRPVSDNYRKVASRHYQLEQERQEEKDKKDNEMFESMVKSNSWIGVIGSISLVAVKLLKPSYHFCKFNAFMMCNSCKDYIAISGLSQECEKEKRSGEQHPALYKIEHFSAPIPMFEIHEYVPSSIQFELLGAFSFFHIDTNSSAHKLRRAIEKFCLELDAKGDNLHRNIDSLRKIGFSLEADLLETLRLVGNEGTHSDGVNEDDLLAAFDIFEEVLTVFKRLHKLNALKEHQKALTAKFESKKPKQLASRK